MDKVALMTIVATFFTSLISFLTILEMKKQRKESYKPIVVPVLSYYALRSYSDGRFSLYTQENSEYKYNSYFYLANAGNGTAINLRIRWEFDFNYIVENYSDKDTIIKFESEILNVKKSNFWVEHNVKAQTEEYSEYLLTAENKTQRILFPSYLSIIMKLSADRINSGLDGKIPDLIMNLDFEDSGYKKYRNEFIFRIHDRYNVPEIGEELLEYKNIWRFSVIKNSKTRLFLRN